MEKKDGWRTGACILYTFLSSMNHFYTLPNPILKFDGDSSSSSKGRGARNVSLQSDQIDFDFDFDIGIVSLPFEL